MRQTTWALLAVLAVAGIAAVLARHGIRDAPRGRLRSAGVAPATGSGRRPLVRGIRPAGGIRARDRTDARGPAQAGPAAGEASGPAAATGGAAGVIPNEYVLSFFDGSDRAAFIRLAEARGFEILDLSNLGHAVRVLAPDAARLRDLLRDAPTPLDSSANFFVRAPVPPLGPSRAPEGGYVGFGRDVLYWLGVEPEHAHWGEGVTVAVLDTGVGSHPVLDAATVSGPILAVSPDQDGADPSGHGTAVASLIVGGTPEVAGIAPAAEILDVPVLGPDGVGDTFTLAQGIVAAVNAGADVINICVGTHGDSFFVEDAVEYALDRGVAVVAAAGNDGVDTVAFPGAYEGVVTVAGVDATGRHLYFSNSGGEIDLAAPGISVNAAGPDGSVVSFSGTSAAVPFVSGAVAALMSLEPGLSAVDAALIVTTLTDDAGLPGTDPDLGHGVLSIDRILDRGVPGIYDVAAGTPFVRTMGEGAQTEVIAYAQNRGTEPIPELELLIDVGGRRESVVFTDVPVGKTVSRTIVLDTATLDADGVDITCSALVRGATDGLLANNVGRTVIVAVAEPAAE